MQITSMGASSAPESFRSGAETDEIPLRSRLYHAKHLASEYSKNFTIHGLSYAIHGSSWKERVAWSIILLGAFVFTGILCQDVTSHDIVTDYSITEADSLPLPKVSVCMLVKLTKHQEQEVYRWNIGNFTAFSNNTEKYDLEKLNKSGAAGERLDRALSYAVFMQRSGICQVLNNNGGRKQFQIEAEFEKGKTLQVSIDEPGEVESFFVKGKTIIYIETGSTTEIRTESKTVKKICNTSSSGKHEGNNQEDNTFKGKYTFGKCKAKCIAEHYLKKCRFLPYHLQHIVKDTWLAKYNINLE